MKKKVNGKVVDIDVEIFEAGFEGLSLNKATVSNISDTIDGESDTIKKCIESYNKIYRSLPFPLYCIESDIKYATIAMYIQDDLRIAAPMWVDKALFILVEKGKALKIVGTTWSIVSEDSEKEDNTNIEKHKEEIGYEEFQWVLSRFMDNKSLANFYSVFMPKFVEACNNEPMILKWELSRVLDFGYLPKKIELRESKIIDLVNDCEYSVDVYCKGKRKTTENMLEITLGGTGSGIGKRSKYVKVYDFDVYSKSSNISEDTGGRAVDKMVKVDMDCMGALFEKILLNGSSDDSVENIRYTGVMDGRHLVFEIGNVIYYSKASTYAKAKELAVGVEIYAYENGRVYMTRTQTVASGVKQHKTYMYDLDTERLRLCKTYYE